MYLQHEGQPNSAGKCPIYDGTSRITEQVCGFVSTRSRLTLCPKMKVAAEEAARKYRTENPDVEEKDIAVEVPKASSSTHPHGHYAIPAFQMHQFPRPGPARAFPAGAIAFQPALQRLPHFNEPALQGLPHFNEQFAYLQHQFLQPPLLNRMAQPQQPAPIPAFMPQALAQVVPPLAPAPAPPPARRPPAQRRRRRN